MRRSFYLLICFAALFFTAWLGRSYLFQRAFSLQGQIAIDRAMAENAGRPNNMLFIVARNEGGAPVAVKKIINPAFPVDFQMNFENLIMPDLVTKSLFLEAFLNNHGELGVFRPGDLKGEYRGTVLFRKNGIKLTLDTAAR